MQDAYSVEADDVGDWGQIGYTAPGVKGESSGEFTSKVFKYTGAKGTWNAEALTALNDCAKGGKWGLVATRAGDGKASVAKGGTNDANCIALTPSFETLTRAAQ